MDLKGYLLQGDRPGRAGVEDQCKKVRTIIAGFRSICQSVKKGCGDMSSALNTIKAAVALKEKHGKDKKNMHPKGKSKITKLPKFASTRDPNIIKIHKVICKRNEAMRANSFETLSRSEDDAGVIPDGSQPFILRHSDGQWGRSWGWGISLGQTWVVNVSPDSGARGLGWAVRRCSKLIISFWFDSNNNNKFASRIEPET